MFSKSVPPKTSCLRITAMTTSLTVLRFVVVLLLGKNYLCYLNFLFPIRQRLMVLCQREVKMSYFQGFKNVLPGLLVCLIAEAWNICLQGWLAGGVCTLVAGNAQGIVTDALCFSGRFGNSL